MCGICGVWEYGAAAGNGAVGLSLVERMRDRMAHRGPDDAGVEVVGQVGLVHRRLSIVDPRPEGHQPMALDGGRWWLTYNGEAFNHAELRGRLPGGPYRTQTDTETVLRALDVECRRYV